MTLKKMVLDGETYFLVPTDEAPRAVAEVFCDMDDCEQAEFFEQVGNVSMHWPESDTQWCAMVNRMSIDAEETLKSMAQFLDSAE